MGYGRGTATDGKASSPLPSTGGCCCAWSATIGALVFAHLRSFFLNSSVSVFDIGTLGIIWIWDIIAISSVKVSHYIPTA